MAGRKRSTRSTRRSNGNDRRRRGEDAISLLKADHREVEKRFAQFEKSREARRKDQLAEEICTALKVHTIIEEEIFYPAFLEATRDKDIHHEAEVEHDSAKKLIAEIEASDARDDYFDARVAVLSEMIKHHVKEEEKPGGMFAEARRSGMDLVELGERLKSRKIEVEGARTPKGGIRAIATRLLEA